jgi:hypothetical protein
MSAAKDNKTYVVIEMCTWCLKSSMNLQRRFKCECDEV